MELLYGAYKRLTSSLKIYVGSKLIDGKKMSHTIETQKIE